VAIAAVPVASGLIEYGSGNRIRLRASASTRSGLAPDAASPASASANLASPVGWLTRNSLLPLALPDHEKAVLDRCHRLDEGVVVEVGEGL
jgi:hypothetical protein